MREYARLELLQEIPLKDGTSKEVAIFRPTARDMAEVLEATSPRLRIKVFVERTCRAFNGSGSEPKPFDAGLLNAADAAELSSVVAEMSREADNIEIRDGDGVFEPIVYDLKYPITLTRDEDGPVVRQIAFKGQKIGDLSEFLDSRGDRQEFSAFMRSFGELLGTKLPMSDAIIEALDFVDYLVIRRKIMGKLAVSRGRWKKTST
jgi:hypothetical protein